MSLSAFNGWNRLNELDQSMLVQKLSEEALELMDQVSAEWLGTQQMRITEYLRILNRLIEISKVVVQWDAQNRKDSTLTPRTFGHHDREFMELREMAEEIFDKWGDLNYTELLDTLEQLEEQLAEQEKT